MKAIASKIGIALLVIIAVPLFIILIVAVLPIILWFVLLDVISKWSARLRKDPKHTPPKRYHIYANNEYPEGEDGVRKYFDRYIAVIQKDCNIKSDAAVVVEKPDADTKLSADDEYLVTLSATLRTNQGVATLKMYAASFGGSDEIFTANQDGDVPPYFEVVYRQPDGLHTVVDVSGYDSLEFLIASLKNGQRLSRAGQIWTKLKDDLYIVNYSVKKSDRSDRIGSDYGYRSMFSDTKARQYFFDKKVTA